MFVYNAVTHDTRVLREAAALRDAGHEVMIIARPRDTVTRVGDEFDQDGIRVVRVPVPHGWRRWWRLVRLPARAVQAAWVRLTGRPTHVGGELGPIGWLIAWRFAIIGWGRSAADLAPVADVYHGHDLSGLVAAQRAAARHGAALVYDSHELFLESRLTATQPIWARWLLARLERGIVARADAVVTVNVSIAAELRARYDPRRIVVVHNCPPRREVQPPDGPDRRIAPASDGLADPIRAAAAIPNGTPVVLYHGAFVGHRGIEELVEAHRRAALSGVHLALLGFGPAEAAYRRLAADPSLGGRVHVLSAVPPDALPAWIAPVDVGAMPIQPSTLNHRLSTPNKLFECLAAGVPVVASDFPEMHRIVIDDPDGPLGAVCDPTDPGAIAAAIASILELDPAERADLRDRCARAAHERWNWETESAKLVALYAGLVGTPGDGEGAIAR